MCGFRLEFAVMEDKIWPFVTNQTLGCNYNNYNYNLRFVIIVYWHALDLFKI